MSIQNYSTVDPRIGKVMGEMLRHSIPREVLGITGKQHKMQRNQSDTVIFRRILPFGGAATNATTINAWVVDANDHLTSEGVTPDADTVEAQDITVQLQEYSCLYMYSNKTAELYEDNIPAEMKKQAGQRMGLVREKIRYGALKGCTNKFYAGGTTRATVDAAISLSRLRRISRSLLGNRADMITQVLKASPNYNTAPVESAFLVFCHTDCENDIRNLEGFREVVAYGHVNPVHPMELGATDRYRFIVSPELDPILNAGATAAGTGLVTSGTNVDIYPIIVVAEDAWGDVALRGMESFDVTEIPAKQKSKSDPLGQRGYIGARFWSAMFIQNDGWAAILEVGITDLDV